jgi:hypothetical protein
MNRRLAFALLALLAVLPYLRSMTVPLLSDDYLVIALARRFGGLDGLGALFADPLYRCRATAMELTWWLDRAFGPHAAWFRAFSIALHAACTLLVARLGRWPLFGWAVSLPAAAFFALHEIKQEAVIWHSAAPELLVFLFCMLTLHAYLAWLEQPRPGRLAALLACFALALLSKESAVMLPPALAGLLLIERRGGLLAWLPPALTAAMCAVYAGAIFAARGAHYHMSDGTFSLGPHFLETLLVSTWRLLWFWGALALVVLAARGAWRRHGRLLRFAALWIPLALLPYCFLTYMNRVPSRATYLASLGAALLAAAAWTEVVKSRPRWAPAIALAAVLHNAGYVILWKQSAYLERAEPTERLIREARYGSGPLSLEGFPYTREVAESAIEVAAPQARARLK